MTSIDLGYWANNFAKHGNFSGGPVDQVLSESAYRKIYKKIITFEYEPGQMLYEKELIEELGLGRTPIREALRTLASHCIIEMHPSKALLVRPITIQNTRALFTAMDILEQSVVRNIDQKDLSEELDLMQRAQRAMAEAVAEKNIFEILMANHVFHMALYHASRNEYLIYGLKRVRFEAERLGFISFSVEIFQEQPIEQLYQILLQDHEQIMALLKERDMKDLQETIYRHQCTFRNRILQYLAPKNPSSFSGDWLISKEPGEE